MLRFALSLFFALLAALAQPAFGQPPQVSEEANQVAREVLSRTPWLADANRCPSALIPQRETLDYQLRNDCKSGQLSACLSKCTAAQPGACYWLGQELQKAGADQQAAEVLFQRSCKLGVMSGCTNRAASMSSEKRDDQTMQACAAATYSKVCAFDDPWACTMYAFLLSRGIGLRQDKDLALKVLSKSCKYGANDEACIYGTRLKQELLHSVQGAQPRK